MGHDLVDSLNMHLTETETCLQDLLLLTLEVQRQSQAPPCGAVGSCLGDGVSVGGKDSFLGKGGGGTPTLSAL